MKYRELQIELKTLREQGLIDQDFKLNAPYPVLAQVHQKYQIRQDRQEIIASPVLIIWLVVACLTLFVGLVYLVVNAAIKLSQMIVRNLGKVGARQKPTSWLGFNSTQPQPQLS